ncbi:phage recombination protein Bet [Gracilibacillus marinus]|uniref:Phage recombination protein Bet n=1 Tax=Gracilibacillus marinus TaxID=630535 RepID=A0ABV8VSP4_9BACI
MTNNQLMNVSYEIAGQSIDLQPETVRNYLVRGNGNVTDQEVVMFMNLCQYQQLNPFVNEAYLIKFGQQPAQIIVSKEAFMKRAESHEDFGGFEAGIVYEIDDEIKEVTGAIMPKRAQLLGGWCKVYRNDREKPIEIKVSYEEFSKNQATWKDMPMNMIRKVAIVNALREAFPNTLGAMYTEEETQKESIPDYKKERKDITPNDVENKAESQESPNKNQDDKLAELKKQMKQKFVELGIKDNKGINEYIQKNNVKLSNPATEAQLIGLIDLLDMSLDMANMQTEDTSDDDELLV